MIARIWRGVTPESQADRYLEYMLATGVKDYRSIEGNRGVLVLRRITDGRAEFLLISLWESLDAVRQYAGADVETAVYYGADKDYLLDLEPRVVHYEVPFESRV